MKHLSLGNRLVHYQQNLFQIQFHNFVNQAKQKRREIRKVLKITHDCKFNFPFIWERWDKKI